MMPGMMFKFERSGIYIEVVYVINGEYIIAIRTPMYWRGDSSLPYACCAGLRSDPHWQLQGATVMFRR